jgi:hypothetical protein
MHNSSFQIDHQSARRPNLVLFLCKSGGFFSRMFQPVRFGFEKKTVWDAHMCMRKTLRVDRDDARNEEKKINDKFFRHHVSISDIGY